MFLLFALMTDVMKDVNDYISSLNLRTNDPALNLFPVSKGVETLSVISTMEVPSMLIQLSLGIGDRTNKKKGLTLGVTKRLQHCIHLFLQIHRSMCKPEHTATEVQVRILKTSVITRFLTRLCIGRCSMDTSKIFWRHASTRSDKCAKILLFSNFIWSNTPPIKSANTAACSLCAQTGKKPVLNLCFIQVLRIIKFAGSRKRTSSSGRAFTASQTNIQGRF